MKNLKFDLYFTVILLLTCIITQSCRKDMQEKQLKITLLDSAKIWYKTANKNNLNNQLGLDLNPDWSNSVSIKNKNGINIIGTTLFKNDSTYVELNFLNTEKKEYGIIKKYNWNSDEMLVYYFNNESLILVNQPVKKPKYTNYNKRIMYIKDQVLPEVIVYGDSNGSNLLKYLPKNDFPYFPIINNFDSEGGGGGGESSSKSLERKTPSFDVTALSKYPKFKNLASNLQNFLRKYPNVLKALKEYTGLSEAKIIELMKPGKGPKIVTKFNLTNKGNDCYGLFNNVKGEITINENYVKGFEVAQSEAAIQATGMLLTIVTLHEFIHFGRDMNNLSLEINGNEAGWVFETNISPRGVTIVDETNAYIWIKSYPFNFAK